MSGITLRAASDVMAWRLSKAVRLNADIKLPTIERLTLTARKPDLRPLVRDLNVRPEVEQPGPLADVRGKAIAAPLYRHTEVKQFRDATAVNSAVMLAGAVRLVDPKAGSARLGAMSVPTVLNGGLARGDAEFDFDAARKETLTALRKGVDQWLADPRSRIADLFREATGAKLFHFLPVLKWEEALSPIGIAHFYRQLYFNVSEGVGPIEQAFTVAPLETLEVMYETVRKQIHEEVLESGTEAVSETAVESKNLDEVSDKVSSMIQRDTQAAMSASAGGSIGVWQASASASADFAVSTQQSREDASRRLKEVTTRAAERITKTFSLRTREVREVTTTSTTRRVLRNDSPEPVSYGLRRVLRRVRVKVQAIGPRLVWQLYLRNPGAGLARSKFVHFVDGGDIAVPDNPPGLRPKPAGGQEAGSTTAALQIDPARSMYFVTVVARTTRDRQITGLSIDTVTDLEGGGKDDLAPSPLNAESWGQNWDPSSGTYSVDIPLLPGDSASVAIGFTFSYAPSAAAMEEWENERTAARAAIEQKALAEKFEREKALITERSRIRPRPAADLRREERYEVMNRMVSQLFGRSTHPGEPTPLEIEYFHRFFDIEMMFSYTHPSWWKPRYSPVGSGLERRPYEITADSEPAPMGASLGWAMQLDGDARRNEFLNSPWVRVCLPIRPGHERDAIEWLAEHLEGAQGYDQAAGPLAALIKKVQETRGAESKLGVNGPNYVTVDSAVGGGDPARPEGVYPVVDEFEVTLPTEGFVYDRLTIRG